MAHGPMDSAAEPQFRLIDGIGASIGGREVSLGGPKQRLVLALLMLEPGRLISDDRLLDGLWGDDAPAESVVSLRSYISKLRAALGDGDQTLVRRTADGYSLAVQDSRIDVYRFAALAERGSRHLHSGQPNEAVDAFREAHEIWPDGRLGTWSDEVADWPAVSRLQRLWTESRAASFEARLLVGDHLALIPDISAAVAAAPLDERLRLNLATALYRAGRHVEALRALDSARRMLADEVGVEPSPQLTRLEQAILRHDPSLAWEPVPTTVAPAAVAGTSAAERVEVFGRADESGRILAAAQAVAGGTGRVVVINGQAGIGKSALASDAIAALTPGGFAVAWARCAETAGSAPFGPWARIARQLESAGAVAGLTTALATHADDDGAQALARTHAEVATALRSAARPIAVVVDDLQWADSATLALIELLAGEVQLLPLLLVATVRDAGMVAAPLADCLTELTRSPGMVRVALGGLTSEAVYDWMAAEHGEAIARRAADSVQARTDGNPFFVRELLALLRGDGRLDEAERSVAAPVPAGVQDVVRRRTSRLAPATQQMLSTAAVIGRRFDSAVLAAVVGAPVATVVDGLAEAEDAGLVSADLDQPGVFTFSHALVSEALSAEISPARRGRVHASIATALADRSVGDAAAVLEEVAYHAFAGASAGTAQLALDMGVAAANAASRAGAFADVVVHLQRCLGVLPLAAAGDAARRQALLAQLAAAQTQAGDVYTGRQTLVDAAALAEDLGDVHAMAATLAEINGNDLWASIDWSDRDEQAIGLIRRCLDALPPGDSPERASLLAALGGQLYYADPPQQAHDASLQAVEMSERLGEPNLLASVLVQRHWATWRPSGNAARRAAAERLIEVAPSVPDRFGPLAHLARFFAAYEIADIEVAEESLRRARATADPRWTPSAWTYLLYAESSVRLLRGQLDQAEASIEATYDAMRRSRRHTADVTYAALRAQLWTERGDTDRALAALELANSTVYEQSIRWFRGWILAEGGRLDEATEQLQTFDGVVLDDWYRPLILTCALHAAASVGMTRLVERCVAQLRPIEGFIACAGSGGVTLGPVALAVARGEHVLGHHDAAVRALQLADGIIDRLDAMPWRRRADELRALL